MTLRRSVGKHKIRNIIGLGVVVVAVLAFAAPFIYIHFIEGPPPPKLSLPTSGTTNVPSGSSASSASGALNVGTGSVVGYRVSEKLLGQNSTAVGRTKKVWGSLDVSVTTITTATFSVNMASVVSDQAQRNSQFDGRIMDVTQYPTAKFTLTSPINLGSTPQQGTVKQYSATGELTMHGVTKSIIFSVSIEGTSSGWRLSRRFRSSSARGIFRIQVSVDLSRRLTTAPSKFYSTRTPVRATARRVVAPRAPAAALAPR